MFACGRGRVVSLNELLSSLVKRKDIEVCYWGALRAISCYLCVSDKKIRCGV
jgi:hypothetical protein